MVRKQRSVGPSLSVNAVWKGTLACLPQTDGAAFGGADGGVPQGGCSPAKRPLGQRLSLGSSTRRRGQQVTQTGAASLSGRSPRSPSRPRSRPGTPEGSESVCRVSGQEHRSRWPQPPDPTVPPWWPLGHLPPERMASSVSPGARPGSCAQCVRSASSRSWQVAQGKAGLGGG